MKRTLKDYLLISLKGMSMGVVELLPGISGGTIAFVVGIYEELLSTIKGAFPAFRQLLGAKTFKQRVVDFWVALNGNFLVALLLGMVAAIVLTAKLVKYLLLHYPMPFYAFVFGLVIASAVLMYKKIPKWTGWCFAFAAVGLAVSLLLPIQPHDTGTIVPLWYLFFCACLASCAFIMPGTSGTFVLVLMGAYYTFVSAMNSLHIPTIAVFYGGCLVGLVAFSNFLSWLLKKFYSWTVALLTGFVIGSLRIIWPWTTTQNVPSCCCGCEACSVTIARNVLPAAYELQTALPAMATAAVLACVAGVVIVLGIEFFAKLISKKWS